MMSTSFRHKGNIYDWWGNELAIFDSVVSEFLDCYKQYQTTKIEQSKALRDSLRDDIVGSLSNFVSRKANDLSEKIKLARERDQKVKQSMDDIEKVSR